MFNFFQKKREDNKQNIDNVINFSFAVDDNKQVHITFDWLEGNDEYVSMAAELLFNIHSGMYAGKTADILADEIKNNSENKLFLSKVILKWKELSEIKAQSDKKLSEQPVIRPLTFSNNVNNQS